MCRVKQRRTKLNNDGEMHGSVSRVIALPSCISFLFSSLRWRREREGVGIDKEEKEREHGHVRTKDREEGRGSAGADPILVNVRWLDVRPILMWLLVWCLSFEQ